MTKIIQFTKVLSTIEDGGENEEIEKMSINDIPEGIHQSKQLVERFKNILFGMNKKSQQDVVFKHNIEQAASFPYNELHKNSPFHKLIDWEPLLKNLPNKSDKRAQMMIARD